MRSVFSHIRLFTALMLFGVMLLSCQKEGPHRAQARPGQESEDVVNAWLSLNLNVVSSGAATKVDDEVDGGINNGIDENAITRLAIWLVPAEGGTEDWSEAIMTYVPQVSLGSGNKYVSSVRTKLNVPMNVYVGANISTDIASAFLQGGPDAVYKAATAAYPDDYKSLVEEFASADRGVAMFCVKKASLTFESANSDKSTPAVIDEDSNGIPESVDLVRMLAKVHLLFQCYETHPEFVKITEPGSLDPADFGEFGWSKLEDISYIVNTVNKSTKIIQPEYGGAYASYMDMNHSMTNLLQKGLEWEYKSAEAAGHFLGFAEDLSGDHDAAWAKWSAKPEKYDGNKAPFGSGDPYVKGLYCLENTTDDSALSSMTDDEKKYVPFMVATHIIVKARFVPRKINTVNGSGDLDVVDYGIDGYDAALAALPEVDGVDENDNSHTYPAGTFFTRDMQEFYDYQGMLKLIETVPELSRKNFATYPGGYGFYYSYINGGKSPSTGQIEFRAPKAEDTANDYNSGVYRNHYHILSCSLMKVPATPGSFNQLMMVNSKVVDWNPKGALNLIVKPNV